MAERQSSRSWIVFLAGVAAAGVIGFGVFAYNGGLNNRDIADMQIDLPDVKVPPPEIDLPAPPPAPQMPPSAEETPQAPRPN